jgi:hypothetical protein
MDTNLIIKHRDNLHRESVRHVTRLSKDHSNFDLIFPNPICTTLESGFIVEIYGIDGETCRLITGKSEGVNVDYPRLKTNELEDLHRMVTQKEYKIVCLI